MDVKIIPLTRTQNAEDALLPDAQPITEDQIAQMSQPFERDVIAALKRLDIGPKGHTFQLIVSVPLETVVVDGFNLMRAYTQERIDVSAGDRLFIYHPTIWLTWTRNFPTARPDALPDSMNVCLAAPPLTNMFRRYKAELEGGEEATRTAELSLSLRYIIQEAVKWQVATLDRHAASQRAQLNETELTRGEILRFMDPFK